MPTTNSITLLNICRVIEQTPDEGLLAIDRDALAATTRHPRKYGHFSVAQRLARAVQGAAIAMGSGHAPLRD